MFKKLSVLMAFTLVVASAVAQSEYSAIAGTNKLFVGGEFSTFNPDWGCENASAFRCWNGHLAGVGALADVNHVWRGMGVEGEGRWLHWAGPGNGLVESSYLAGPRYPLFQRPNFAFYAKGLVGLGRITRPFNLGQGSYFALAPGGTVEYGITRNIVVRGEYEFQFWPNFQGLPGLPAHGLTPNGLSFGFGYRL